MKYFDSQLLFPILYSGTRAKRLLAYIYLILLTLKSRIIKKSFAIFAVALMSVCVTSTAMADMPAPISVDIPEIAIDPVPILYYSAARVADAPFVSAATQEPIKVFEYQLVVCYFYISPSQDPNLEITVFSPEWNWGTENTDYQLYFDPRIGLLEVVIRDVGEAGQGTIFVTAKNQSGSAWGYTEIEVRPIN